MKRISTLIGPLMAVGLVTTVAAAGGQLDRSFGNRGIVATATAPADGADWQNGLAIRPNGSVVVAGSSDMGASAGGHHFRLSQYTKRGALDGSFGGGGTVLTSVSSVDDGFEHIWEIALAPGGKIVAAGEANMGPGAGGDNYALARYNADGSLDTSFGGDGVVTTSVASLAGAPGDNRDNANAVALQTDGKIVAAGGIRMGAGNSNNDFVVVRYNPDGSLDTSFDGDGIVTTAVAPGTRNDGITGLVIQPDGKIVAGGQANMGAGAGGTDFAFARYNADGSLDVTFGGDGIVTTSVAPGDRFDTAWTLALQLDGKIVGAGNADLGPGIGRTDAALARYNPDGSLDTSFGGDGIATAPLGPGDAFDDVFAVAIDSAGRFVIGGDTVGAAFYDSALARFSSNGALDPSFGNGGVVVTPTAPDGGYDAFYEVAIDKTGKIVASGECDRPTTGTDVCVARHKAATDE